MPSYEELQEFVEMISSDSSLHLWDEIYLYNEIQYKVMGAISDPSYVEISILNKE